jgi:hypothetical protein
LGQAKSVPNSEVSSFHRAISTENRGLGPDEVSLFHRMSSFRRVAIHRFHCILDPHLALESEWQGGTCRRSMFDPRPLNIWMYTPAL